MVLEKILFIPPNPPHYTLTSHGTHLIWLPAGDDPVKMPKIPCMLYSPNDKAEFFMIWCHGNACDVGSMDYLLNGLNRRINAHILIFEYPSYGLCPGPTKSNRQTVNNHAERAYSFVHDTLQWPTDRILIYGHSIGSGPACHIASTKNVGGLILQSPYTSITGIIREYIGFVGYLLGSSYWNNLDAMNNIHCRTLFIHGQNDNIIPSQHSQTLHDSLIHVRNKQLILIPGDDHNSISDLKVTMYVKEFLEQFFSPPSGLLPSINIDPEFRNPPVLVESPSSTSSGGICASLFEFSRASTNATVSLFNSVLSNQSENNNG